MSAEIKELDVDGSSDLRTCYACKKRTDVVVKASDGGIPVQVCESCAEKANLIEGDDE